MQIEHSNEDEGKTALSTTKKTIIHLPSALSYFSTLFFFLHHRHHISIFPPPPTPSPPNLYCFPFSIATIFLLCSLLHHHHNNDNPAHFIHEINTKGYDVIDIIMMIPLQNNKMVPTVLNSIWPDTYNDPNWRYVLSSFTHLYWVVNIRTAESPSSFVSLSIRVTSRPCLAASTDIIVGGNWRWSPARTHLARTKVHVKPILCVQLPPSPQKTNQKNRTNAPHLPSKSKSFSVNWGCPILRDAGFVLLEDCDSRFWRKREVIHVHGIVIMKGMQDLEISRHGIREMLFKRTNIW